MHPETGAKKIGFGSKGLKALKKFYFPQKSDFLANTLFFCTSDAFSASLGIFYLFRLIFFIGSTNSLADGMAGRSYASSLGIGLGNQSIEATAKYSCNSCFYLSGFV